MNLCRYATLTLCVCRSSCSRWLPRCPPPQLGWGTRRCSSTSCGRTRSQTPRPAWGTAAHPPDTSRRTQPGSRSGGCRRWWSTPADRRTHAGIRHKGKRSFRGENLGLVESDVSQLPGMTFLFKLAHPKSWKVQWAGSHCLWDQVVTLIKAALNQYF